MRFVFFLVILILFAQSVFAAKVDTISIYSFSMNKSINNVVVTPDDYLTSDLEYPVVYLLHGYGGDYTSWINLAPQIKEFVDEMSIICVCPDGGYRSWYLDSPIDTSFKYETYIASELLKFVDLNYRTKADKRFRAISGLSMGGHGALYLTCRHPDLFGAAGSSSGGVDLRKFTASWDLKEKILGDTICCKQNWEDHSVVNSIGKLRKKEVQLIIDCGQQDFFLDVNRNLHARMLELNIDHDYIERPGEHTSEYWQSSIDFHFLFFHKFFLTADNQKK